jgi:CubicO group peptidase (beta-lactamase class C family)
MWKANRTLRLGVRSPLRSIACNAAFRTLALLPIGIGIITPISAVAQVGSASSSAELRHALATTAQQLFDLGAAPGLGIVVVRDTQTLFVGGFGFANVETKRPFTATTPFYIASTTKSFTGLAAAILEQQGKWQLDAPLKRILPDVVLHRPLSPGSITIRDLLTHTHGISNEGPIVQKLAYTGDYTGNDDLLRLLREHDPAPTGRSYVYGNIGYNIAALAMDAVTGVSWKRTLQELIFDPLAMRGTTGYASQVDTMVMAQPYRSTLDGFVRRNRAKTDATMHSAGGLFTTPEDMGRWLLAHINDGRMVGRSVIPAAAIQESHRVMVPVNAINSGYRLTGYGLGWQIGVLGNDRILTHGGGFTGYATQMSFIPNRREGVAVMANNLEIGGRAAPLIARALFHVLRTGKPVPADSITAIRTQLDRARASVREDINRRASRPQVLPLPLDSYTGTFRSSTNGSITLTKVGTRLAARMGSAVSTVEVYDAAKNQLRVELFGGGTVIAVNMDGDRAISLTHGGAVFKRAR